MLDIIVTHYKEPWKTVRPFFDMLGCQRGVNFDDIRVILVNDGTELFPEERFEDYPYKVEQYSIPHGGVSAARNFGLDRSSAEWIEFCDCDDCYTHIYGLRMIMGQMHNDVDYIWTPFFSEYDAKELAVRTEDKENLIFIHGKYFRRSFLVENNIRFPEGISFSEDSVFCTIVNSVSKVGRHGKVGTKFPVYTWLYRGDSVSTNPANKVQNMNGFYERNICVVEEMKRRGIDHTKMVGRMFADAYWAFHRRERYPEYEKRFIENCGKYLNDLDTNDPDTMMKILCCSRDGFKNEEIETNESFSEWVSKLKRNEVKVNDLHGTEDRVRAG